MSTQNTFYSWNTKKVNNGFKFTVSKVTSHSEIQPNGSYATSEIVKTGVLTTRARAKSKAQQWLRYFKAIENKAA